MEQMPKIKAVMVGLQVGDQPDFEHSMEEFKNLAEARGVEVLGVVTQKTERIHPATFIGSGKLEEVKALAEGLEADEVLFNDELSPAQISNLEKKLERRVVDRTMLILDIFAERAKTREAQLQVEAAQLRYLLPRLVGMRASLSRQGGGSGLHNRGAGETKLELDRRRIEDRLAALEKELAKLAERRDVLRRQRRKNELPVVSLVGYTNTGKSSLLNAILEQAQGAPAPEKKVFAKDMLSATLETSTRRIRLAGGKEFLLTDTVGFVSRLPHHLVKAFRSTLEEAAQSDLLLHVADAANPHRDQYIEVTNETLRQLGADRIPTIMVYNKADLTDNPAPRAENGVIYVSALRREGLDLLLEAIAARLFGDYVRGELLIPFDKGHLVAYFNEHADVRSARYLENGTLLEVECRRADYERFREHFL